MRPEKKYLVEEVSRHLDKSDFVFLTDYNTVTVSEIAELRANLRAESAEFHVVKNSILNVAAKERSLPALDEWLSGPTAIVTGGENPAGVAKVLKEFSSDKKKLEIKVGVLGDRTLTVEEVKTLADLPSIEILHAQLLGLFSQPAQRLATVLAAGPVSLLNVLKAKSEQAA
ncbi:MAG TPA: 50S ribosomal protein L10 [Opitutales bacterium]|nr:50S ribosomal protein L10 [Opitutales bacterium]